MIIILQLTEKIIFFKLYLNNMIYAIDINQQFQPAKFANISSLINIVLPLLSLGAALVFLTMALYGGFMWITSGGNQENLAKSRKVFINAILGFCIVVFGFVFVKIIGFIFKINILP